MFRGLFILIGILLIVGPPRAHAVNIAEASRDELKSRQSVASKLDTLTQAISVISSLFPGAGLRRGMLNRDDGTSSGSPSTFHAAVMATCQKWINSVKCGEWLDEGISPHAFTADSSANEKKIGDLWAASNKGETGTGMEVQHGIYDIQKKTNGSVLDRQGRMDWKNIASIKLNDAATEAAKQVGYKTANQTLNLTMDESAKRSKIDPNKVMRSNEELRTLAAQWTHYYRANALNKEASTRAAIVGIEIPVTEGMGCDEYSDAVNNSSTKNQDRLESQGILDPQTRRYTVAARVKLCKQARAMSAYDVGGQVVNGELKPSDLESERADTGAYRLTLASLDQTGVDLATIPSNRVLTQEDQKVELGNYDAGGVNLNRVTATNAEQLGSYNQGVRDTAAAYKRVVARTGKALKDQSENILAKQMPIGAMKMEQVNGLTAEMREFLAGTNAPAVAAVDPAKNPVDAPAPESAGRLIVTPDTAH